MRAVIRGLVLAIVVGTLIGPVCAEDAKPADRPADGPSEEIKSGDAGADCRAFAETLSRAFAAQTVEYIKYSNRVQVDLAQPDMRIYVSCESSWRWTRIAGPYVAGISPGELKKVVAIAGRAAELYAGAQTAEIASAPQKCLASVKPKSKRAGKIGLAHAREIWKIPHFEGEVKLPSMRVACSYDYADRKELKIDFYPARE